MPKVDLCSVAFFGRFLLLMAVLQGGSASARTCPQKVCDHNLSLNVGRHKIIRGSNLRYCWFLQEYHTCLLSIKNNCLGNIRYHAMSTVSKRYIASYNCTAILTEYLKNGGESLSTWTMENVPTNSAEYKLIPQKPSPAHIDDSKCYYPVHHGAHTDYRHCGMFGDPHLRTFDGHQETCRTTGAWPLVDNAFVAVQVTNEAIAPGLTASGIARVTVIIRSFPGCTEQKTFEGTKGHLPSAFIDGSTQSPSRGPRNSLTSPSVFIKTVIPGEHIEIHLRYIATSVTIRYVGGYLTFAIKIPADVIHQQSASSLQLCQSGCPVRERIDMQGILADPAFYISTVGLQIPLMPKDQAIEICREAGATDFYFDSCVFDLITTGNPVFSTAAVSALSDVRTLHPSYQRHYELNRTDLKLYDSQKHVPTPPRVQPELVTPRMAASVSSGRSKTEISTDFLISLALLACIL